MNLNTDLTVLLKHPIVPQLRSISDQLSIDAYLVGGCIRDHILNRPFSKELDIVVVGSGVEFAKATHASLKKTTELKVFKNFGTAMFKYGDITLEFVGARKESYSRHSRKPVVESGSLRDDQLRRDFSINALAVGLNSRNYGQLIDPFNGFKDMKQRLIRTPLEPHRTFSDDPLRMLRAIRFATVLEFEIDPITFKGIISNRHRLEIVSRERVVEELNKILSTQKPSIGFISLDKCGILELILPEITDLKGVDVIDGQSHKDNFYHSLQVVDNISKATSNLWLRWAALLHDIGKSRTKEFTPQGKWTFWNHEAVGSRMVKGIFKRLRMPLNEKLHYVQKLVAMSSRPVSVANDNVTDSAVRRLVFDAGEEIDDLITLCQADITTKNKKKFITYYQNFELVKKKILEVEERDRLRNFQPPISGDFIMNYFNIKPSREVGQIKGAIIEAILQGEIDNNFDQAHIVMSREGEKLGLEAKEKYQKKSPKFNSLDRSR